MAIGVIVRDINTGEILFGPEDRISRIIGRTTIGPGSGFLSVPEFGAGDGTLGWFMVLDSSYAQQGLTSAPSIYIETTNGGGIRWTQGSSAGALAPRAVDIIYGAY